jgi:hypothetical protein
MHGWLQDVLHNVKPWMSRRDIGAGARWGQELDEQLDATDFGILCVTPENALEPWLNYEAGALAKRVSASRVVPYLIEMTSAADLPQGPLSRFQAKVAMTETLDVVSALNLELKENGFQDSEKLRRAYARWWPDLESVLKNVPVPAKKTEAPDLTEMMREVVETVRELARSRTSQERTEIALQHLSKEVRNLRKRVGTDPDRTRRPNLDADKREEADSLVAEKLKAAANHVGVELESIEDTGVGETRIRFKGPHGKTINWIAPTSYLNRTIYLALASDMRTIWERDKNLSTENVINPQ